MSELHASPDTTSPSNREDVRHVSDHWEVAGFARTMIGEHSCGDAISLYPVGQVLTALVVDGLGHGSKAHEASMAAVAHVNQRMEENPAVGIESLMTSCNKALSGTRGAAVGICRLDPERAEVRFCGVGNIALTSFPNRRGMGVSLAGVVGYRMRKVKEFVCEVEPGDLVALYSDGISSRLSLKKMAKLPMDRLLKEVMADWAKDHDDATFLGIRYVAKP